MGGSRGAAPVVIVSLEEAYQLEFFEENGFERKRCPECGMPFWTQDPERELCGDPPCVEYGFIGEPLTDEEYTLGEMRERFLRFMEDRDHTRVDRRPVVARWRDDIYLTIASIADFQPHVTSGESRPPANPLTISQPCIRLNDLDSVGKSGRHLTTFEMMAHHAFNRPDEEVYWTDRTVELCHEFMTRSLGMDGGAITYKENPWSGGGNAGPALEVLVGGLEVATLVFMSLEEHPEGNVEIKGDTYRRMDLRIVDTGYGLERLVWASNGAPTIYDAIYPDIVERLVEAAGLQDHVEDPRVSRVLREVARTSSVVDVDAGKRLLDLRREVLERLRERAPDLDLSLEELTELLEPLEAVYAVADHTRCLAFMLGDGVVPSNVKGGYLARLVVRRTLRLMDQLDLPQSLGELVSWQIDLLGDDFPELKRMKDTVLTICELETKRYRETLEKGSRLVRKEARNLGNGELDVDRVIEFYDSHGVPPDIVRNVAREEGVEVEIPDDFYTRVAERHSGEGTVTLEEEGAEDRMKRRLKDLPPTDLLYYDDAKTREFEAVVLWAKDDVVVLDQTAFYPEGGGQPSDRGHILTESKTLQVTDVQKRDGVVVHHVEGGRLRTGDVVRGRVDWGRRIALMRNHTATHIVIAATRHVLGSHVWQAGAQKGTDRSRIDVSHFRRVTDEELREIEQLANMVVLESLPVEKRWLPRDEAERKHGMQLYQGGIPPGDEIRVVRITDFDVEACGGTHVWSTSDVGPIKVLGSERVQDGVERIHFSAGLAAVRETQKRDQILDRTSDVFRVPMDDLPRTAERFFEEWKGYRKEAEELRKELAELKTQVVDTETVGGAELLLRFDNPPDTTRDDLFAELTTFVNEGPGRVAAGATPDGQAIVVTSEEGVDVEAPAVLRRVAEVLGGKGGGRGTMAQGKLEKVDADAAARAVREALEDG